MCQNVPKPQRGAIVVASRPFASSAPNAAEGRELESPGRSPWYCANKPPFKVQRAATRCDHRLLPIPPRPGDIDPSRSNVPALFHAASRNYSRCLREQASALGDIGIRRGYGQKKRRCASAPPELAPWTDVSLPDSLPQNLSSPRSSPAWNGVSIRRFSSYELLSH